MNYLEKLSKNLSDMTGIANTPILLVIYSTVALVFFNLLFRGITFLNTELRKDEKKKYTFNKKANAFKIILELISLFFIWEKQITSILTLLGFIGAAATLALKDIVLNFFAGLFISIYKPFRIEDRIEVAGMTGDVININSLNFEILEVSEKDEGEQSTGIIIQIPNYKVFTEPVKNYTKAFKYIWSEIEVNIKLDADIKHTKEVLYAIVNSNDIVKRIPKKMQLELNKAMGDYRIYYNNLEPMIYTKLNDKYITLTIRYLAHPKKARHIKSQIWNTIYESAKEGNLKLYTTEKISKK